MLKFDFKGYSMGFDIKIGEGTKTGRRLRHWRGRLRWATAEVQAMKVPARRLWPMDKARLNEFAR